jgi:hypothetical protein
MNPFIHGQIPGACAPLVSIPYLAQVAMVYLCAARTLCKKKGFPALGISIYIHLQRRDKMDEKLSTYYIHICKEKERGAPFNPSTRER